MEETSTAAPCKFWLRRFVALQDPGKCDRNMLEGASLMSAVSTEKRYALLATAIAGRSLMMSISRLEFAYTDGQVLYLPEAQSRTRLLCLFVQAAILRSGGFDRKIALKLVGRERVAARYMTLEAIRSIGLIGDAVPRWVQECIASAWDGPISLTPETSLERATMDRSIPEVPQMLGTLRPLILLKVSGLTGGGSQPGESERRRAEQNVSQDGDDEDEEEDEEKKERSRVLSSMSGPLPDNPMSKFFKNMFGAKGSSKKDGEGGSGVELVANSVKWVKKIGAGAKLVASTLRPAEWETPPVIGTLYPEWDHEAGVYRPQWCQVVHYEAAVTPYLDHGVPDRLLRRRLARLGTTYVRHHNQTDGEDLDESALIRFLVDQASGHSGEERVYETRRKTGRDLSAIVLLDASGSTADQQAGGESIWDVQRKVAQDIVAALDDLGDIVAAYGFRSFGRNDVRFLRIKDFEERLSQEARARLHSLSPSGYTRLGPAIRHATHLLATKAHSENQLLVVVSDGLPYDISYEDTYAEQDVRRALDEAEKQGVACVCLSVGSPRKPDALERVWGNVGHASLDSPLDLHRYAEPLFRTAIKRASGGHRRKAA